MGARGGGSGRPALARPAARLWLWRAASVVGVVVVVAVAVAAGVHPVAAAAARGGRGGGGSGGGDGAAPAVRRYYLSAETHTWDYTPSGINRCTGRPFSGALEVTTTVAAPGGRVGSTYVKARYVAYTDATFTTREPVDAHLGAVGPALYAAAGDELHVTLRNRLDYPVDLQVGGLAAWRRPTRRPPPPSHPAAPASTPLPLARPRRRRRRAAVAATCRP